MNGVLITAIVGQGIVILVLLALMVLNNRAHLDAAIERTGRIAQLERDCTKLTGDLAALTAINLEAGAEIARLEQQRDRVRDELLRRVNPLDYPMAHAYYLEQVPDGREPWTTWVAREGARTIERLFKADLLGEGETNEHEDREQK